MKYVRRGQPLTVQELRVFAMIADAKSNKYIGIALYLSEGTVKVYSSRIYKKLGLKTRGELIIYALRKDIDALKEEIGRLGLEIHNAKMQLPKL